ncbi:methyl-accepting chemotaxis protein [Paenibacillus segetis]|uniref:Methyl-accepting chemotaxis sensory transducer n=1 Tax=Paenibacillus segetis TaxID=1325360 RepID=A0ABQ1Y680_9BACL|nr:methyl-accepting chemotaxis protein [Paenibacillus segetis]GGH13445.1 methyl-accepting chemotaxis sensory transducer [Paenibacillus segetis]
MNQLRSNGRNTLVFGAGASLFLVIGVLLQGGAWYLVILSLLTLVCQALAWLTQHKSTGNKHDNVEETNWNVIANESLVAADRLQAAVGEVNGSIEQLQSLADKASLEDMKLKRSSERSLEQVQESLAAMEEVAASAAQIQDVANTLHARSEKTRAEASRMAEALKTADGTIHSIADSQNSIERPMVDLEQNTRKLGALYQDMEGIAGEVSLLALNASIEAARFGDQGKGFDVVASRMRQLAQQTTLAIGNSAPLFKRIEEDVEKVKGSLHVGRESAMQGISFMRKMGEDIRNITEEVATVDGLVADTGWRSREQAELTRNMESMMAEVHEALNHNITHVEGALVRMESQRRHTVGLQAVAGGLQKASAELMSSLDSVRDSSEDFMDGISDVVELGHAYILKLIQAAKQPVFQGMEESIHRTELTNLLGRENIIEAAWTNRRDGSFVISIPEAGLLNARGRDWFKRALAGESVVSEVYISAITKRRCVTISVPISSNGVVIGVLGADLAVGNVAARSNI